MAKYRFDEIARECRDTFKGDPVDQYNAMKETEYLMASKEMEKAILAGMEDVRKGNSVEVNIDEL